ncbi:transcription termination/antitermination protein NusG [Georhizobium profundi]|nr:transcription termination/antitermination NusG family protein [Georhizobium profundi]
MMMAKIEQQLNDPEAADRAFQRWQRDRALDKALREGLERESFPREGGPVARWYVLRVKRRTEERVAEAVDKLGLTRWVPIEMVNAKHRRHGGSRIVERPIFEGFVFVELVGNAYAWLFLLGIQGVQSILGSEHGPMPVDRRKMSDLMKMVDAGVFDGKKGARDRAKALIANDFPVGCSVTIASGPFEYLNAVVDGYAPNRHVRAMVNLFGRQCAVDLSIDQIKRLV